MKSTGRRYRSLRGSWSSVGLLIAGTFSFGTLSGCGGRTNFIGSEEQAYGSGVGATGNEGDGDSGDGDGTIGDGDDVGSGGGGIRGDGDGDFIQPPPGDGDGDLIPPPPGDGDGDLIPPPPGDGDGDIQLPPGDGDGDMIFPGDGDGDGDGDSIFPEQLNGCGLNYRNQSSDYCDLSYSCDEGYLWTNCWKDGDRSYCDCQGPNGPYSLQVGAGIEVACDAGAEFCLGGHLDTGGMGVCENQYENYGPDYCDSGEVCVSQGQTPSGVAVGVTSWNSTWCSGNGSDWDCQCSGRNGELSLTFTPSSEGITACREANAICHHRELELDGELQCERDYQSASDDWCDIGLRCFRETVVDNATVSINSSAYAACQPQSDTEWACTCDGLGFYGGFSVEGASSWESCEDAGVMCARLIAEQ
jgi:hypothetical protein